MFSLWTSLGGMEERQTASGLIQTAPAFQGLASTS